MQRIFEGSGKNPNLGIVDIAHAQDANVAWVWHGKWTHPADAAFTGELTFTLTQEGRKVKGTQELTNPFYGIGTTDRKK